MVMYVDMQKFTLNSGSLFGCNVARAFPVRAALILFLSIFGHKIGVLKSQALFQEKDLKLHSSRSRITVSQIAALVPRIRIHQKRSVHLFETVFQAKMKSLFLLLLLTFAKASPSFEGKLSLNSTNSAMEGGIPRSCLYYLNQGILQNGFYPLYDNSDKVYVAFCDLSNEPGSAWTLVMSWMTKYKDLPIFKNRAFNNDAPINEDSPNWKIYRQTYSQMYSIRQHSTHWRATCNVEQYKIDYQDYLRGKFSDFDILHYDGLGTCQPVEYVNILGNPSDSGTTVGFWQFNGMVFLHIDSTNSDCGYVALANPIVDYFGYYGDGLSSKFRCSQSLYSTTQWWFGGYLEEH